MAATRKTKLMIWVLTLVIVMACVPTLASPSIPTAAPGAVNTIIAQTAIAAASRTAAAMPSLTPTITITPTRNTETPSPTMTATVIFILSSPTSPVIPTFTGLSSGSGSGTSSANYACQVTKVSPANGTAFGTRDDFDAVWTVKNIGQKNWDRNTVDYFYVSGAKIHKVSGYDLNTNVKVAETTNITVDMEAPKDPGNYTTTWTLQAGDKTFCSLTLTINVN